MVAGLVWQAAAAVLAPRCRCRLLPCHLPTGNGFPIGGLVTSPSMAAAFAAGGMEYFNTYGEGAVAAMCSNIHTLGIRFCQQQRLQQEAWNTLTHKVRARHMTDGQLA
jgi:hypothetical protein